MAKSLKHKAASGMVWTALQKYSKMIIQFISGIILARLLTPHDYGCIGMLMIFMVLAEAFIDGGFGSALIQKKRPTQTDYSTIFWWNLGMAVVMYAILYVSAPAIARFYDIGILCDVLRVQGLVLFIYALNIIQRNQLRKKLNFKILSVISILTSVLSLAITVIMAYMGFGVWALVAQNLLVAGIPALAFWFYVKWRPVWTFSWQSFRELFSFGFYMFLTHLLNQFGNQFQGLLIGRFYNANTMGYYSKAQGTEKHIPAIPSLWPR
jgi:O-antigen/teichoic acid export membrane protein